MPTGKVTEHFAWSEFGLLADASPRELLAVRCLATYVLEPARQEIQMPVTITSGFRTRDRNKRVGGATHSQHLYAEAADVVPSRNVACECPISRPCRECDSALTALELALRPRAYSIARYPRHVHVALPSGDLVFHAAPWRP